jgi:hypothetical protein
MSDETVIVSQEAEDAEATQAALDAAEKLKAGVEGGERPDWLPEEFDSVDAFLQSYNELKQGQSADEDDAEGDDSADGNEEQDDEQEDSSQEESDGIDFDSLTEEYVETGTLSEETIDKLVEQGIPREVVQIHLDGLNAQAELTRYRAAERFGGEEQLQAVLQWAGQSLSEAEIDRINGLVAAGDFEGYLLAMEGVKARYEANFGSIAPQSIQGTTTPVADLYESAEEMKADMRDPRYAKDEAFRSRVAAKLARTRRAGIL